MQQFSSNSLAKIIISIIVAIIVGIGGYFMGAKFPPDSLKSNQKVSTTVVSQTEPTLNPTDSGNLLVKTDATTTNATADWKTYTNTKYAFTLKYPGKYYLIDTYAEGDSNNNYPQTFEDMSLSLKKLTALNIEGCSGSYSMSVNKASDYPNGYKSYFENGQFDYIGNAKVVSTEIDGHEAYLITGTYKQGDGQATSQTVGSNAYEMYIVSGDNIISFENCTRGGSSVPLEEFNQIISTLKFIK